MSYDTSALARDERVTKRGCMSSQQMRWNEPTETTWSADRWQVTVRGDELADITFDDLLVLRAVRFVPRDRDWRTPIAMVEAVALGESTLRLTLRSTLDALDVDAEVTVKASEHRLEVTLSARANTDFWANRLGLVAQLPLALAGAPLTVRHPDGTQTAVSLPAWVSPHQPVQDIAALRWSADTVDVEVRFEGDTFEMEDQRNWTDASFKIYCPPLSLPFPRLIPQGERVEQRIVVSTSGGRPARATAPADAVVTLDPAGRPMPAIGVGASTAPGANCASPSFSAQFVLVELPLDEPIWPAALDKAAAAGLPLDVRLVTGDVALVPAAVALLRAV